MCREFHPDVRRKSLDSKNWDEVYVIGDVHGCASELDSLLKISPITEDDLVLFVGDLVRKGPDSESVVQSVLESENMFSVMGNNEQKLVEGTKILDSLSSESLEWISNLPHIVTVGSLAVVHGGFDFKVDIGNHTPNLIMNMRSLDGSGYDGTLWYEMYSGPFRVFGGHTVHNEPYVGEHGGCLDTGCVYGGGLTALRVSDDSIFSVSSDEYIHRDRNDIVMLEDGRYFD